MPSILVVEDDTDLRSALEDTLSTDGFRVFACSNGREALDWLETSPRPSLIVLDLMMPVMDGWQFRDAQRRDPNLATIPVLALSAACSVRVEAVAADAYLKKPVDSDRLVEAIERLLFEDVHLETRVRPAAAHGRALGTMAAGVAHEINGPLAYLLLNLEFLRKRLGAGLPPGEGAGEATSELADALQHSLDGAHRIRDIVRALSLFSRPELREIEPVDVAKVLDAAIDTVDHEIRPRARLVKSYRDVPEVMGNQGQLGQVFLNLLLNAVQSLSDTDVSRNEIRVSVRGGEAGRVVVEVIDNGAGIPPRLQGRIFEPFFTTKPLGVGTGLGLAICRGIVASLGGSLSFETKAGVGSVFRVELVGWEGRG